MYMESLLNLLQDYGQKSDEVKLRYYACGSEHAINLTADMLEFDPVEETITILADYN